MRRHPFDPIALVFGLTFAGAAIVVLAGGSLSDDGDFLLPACLLGLGVALLVQNASRSRPPRPAVPAATPTATDPTDLDHDALYRAALDDLDAVDGTSAVRTIRAPSGIEWTGPPTPSPSATGTSGRLGSGEDIGQPDDLGSSAFGADDTLGAGADAPVDADDGGPAAAGSASDGESSLRSDEPTDRPGD